MAFDLQSIAPYLGATGQALIDLDEDKTGAEDFAGALLVFAADVSAAVVEGGDLPEFPEALKKGTSDKITGGFRATLVVANSVLTVARFQASGRAASLLKYVTQAISQLLAGQTVAAPSAALVKPA
jgi:hypothetical protein